MESDFDPLAKAFTNDQSFQILLRNRTFVDYLNTFLSLPVFAVRVLYRRDIKTFELEQPIARTAHHVIHDNVLTWVRINRGAMFLKTSICNEFRLCSAILDLPVCLKLDGYDEDEISKFHSKYIAKVIDMQRLKGYMQGSIGENLILFWLDAERFRRQVPRNCRRFVLKEICAKYLVEGAMHELSFALRERVNNEIKKSMVERDKRGIKTVLSSTFLIPAQRIVLQSLQVYWIPKYVLHRCNRRGLIKKRWTMAIFGKKKKNGKKKTKFADLVTEMTQKKSTSPTPTDEKTDNISLPDEHIKKTSSSTAIVEIKETNISESKSQILSQSASESKPTVPFKDERVLKRRKQLSPRKKPVEENTSKELVVDEDCVPLYKRVIKQRRENENQDQISAGLSGKGSSSLIATPSICLEYEVKDQTLFPPSKLLPNIVAQDKKKTKKTTFFESVHRDAYEADCEDNNNINRAESTNNLQLPLVKTIERKLSQSYVSNMMELPKYPSAIKLLKYKDENTLSMLKKAPDDDYTFNCLLAALTTDQVAGQPLLEFFRETGKKVAESNLKFWTASNDVLTDSRCDDPIMRQKQYHSLIHLHLSEFSGSYVSLPQSVKEELSLLLPKDTGVTKLVEATSSVAMELLKEWDEFLKYDRRIFLKKTTKVKRRDAVKEEGSMLPVLPKKGQNIDLTTGHNFDYEEFIFDDDSKKKGASNVANARRMWRAMELAISISKPKHAEIMADANDQNNWTTDSSASSDSDDDGEGGDRSEKRVAGSLASKTLEYINQKQERLKKLEDLFNKNKFKRASINHEYVNEALFKDMSIMEYNEGDSKKAKEKEDKEETRDKPPRPRTFVDILMNTVQLDHFKKYLMKTKDETPLLFWCAVESMRVTCKNAMTRQGRTNGIIKRFFSQANNYGENLQCNADIILEIPNLQTVTPAMLISAQAAVSKSIEERWFAKYQQTFEETGGVTGITCLPIYGAKGDRATLTAPKRSHFRGKSRGLWRMFTRNVISFRRGIMNDETKNGFRTFLQLQHQINVDAATAAKLMTDGMPPTIDVNNKKIHTSKLVADLDFWCEVGRYKDFADAVVLCAKLGNYTKDDELLVVQKAKAIIDCFFSSQVPPRVQVNVNNDIAENIMELVQNGIIERGIFHEAALSTFSTLIGFWKKYCLYRFLPLEKKIALRKQLKQDRSALILAKVKAFRTRKLKKVALPQLDSDECTKLMFSLQLGLRLGIPRSMMKRRTTFIAEDESESNSMFIQLNKPMSNTAFTGLMSSTA